jgi:hypothetical protein
VGGGGGGGAGGGAGGDGGAGGGADGGGGGGRDAGPPKSKRQRGLVPNQEGGGETDTEESPIVNNPTYYLHPISYQDNNDINAVIDRCEAYTKTGEHYKPSLNIDAVKEHIETLSTITSIADFAKFIQKLLYLTQEDAYESNYAYDTYAVDVDYLVEGHGLGRIDDIVLTEQMDWYVYAHPETSNILQNTIPFELFVSIHKKLAEVGVTEEAPAPEPAPVLVSQKLAMPTKFYPTNLTPSLSPPLSQPQAVAAAAGGARRSRRRHRSSPRRPRRITRRKRHDSASHKRRTIRRRK